MSTRDGSAERQVAVPRAPWVWLTVAVAVAAVTWWTGPGWDLPSLVYLTAISVILTIADLRTTRLPNAIVLPSIPIAAALLALPAIADGEPERLITTYAGGLAMFGFYLTILVISPQAIGGGDVKLAAILGQYLGYHGWTTLLAGGLLGYLLGALIMVLALVIRRRGGESAVIPYGPSMIAGSWIVLMLISEPSTAWP